jgi:hypothetical protein
VDLHVMYRRSVSFGNNGEMHMETRDDGISEDVDLRVDIGRSLSRPYIRCIYLHNVHITSGTMYPSLCSTIMYIRYIMYICTLHKVRCLSYYVPHILHY